MAAYLGGTQPHPGGAWGAAGEAAASDGSAGRTGGRGGGALRPGGGTEADPGEGAAGCGGAGGISLKGLWLRITGDREVRLSKEEAEALAAQAKYEQALRDVEDARERLADLGGS